MKNPASFGPARARKPPHPFEWLAEPLLAEPSFILKSWFGGRTIMLHGQHQLFLSAQGEPWQGLLVCTFHEHQPSLCAEFPSLAPHPILKKWLYLPERHEQFERDAQLLVQRVRARDPRIGITPSPGKKSKTASAPAPRIRFGDKL
jgi:hypothetical protein